MSRFDLLPPNASTLERNLSRVTSSVQRAGGPVPIIRTAKRIDIPDSVVPWLIYEYGLGEILPYIGNNQRRAIAEGVLWQRIRGTPEAIRIALTWIDVIGTLDESEGGTYRWAEYQLGLAAAITSEQTISDIVGVARISAPVRSRLQRIYAVYDHRRFVLDDSLLSDGGILSDHSGVRPRPDWPQISFGQNLSALVQENAAVVSAHTVVHAGLVENQDRFRLDHSLIDEEWHGINHPSLLTTQEGVSVIYGGQTWAPVKWSTATTWLDTNVLIVSSMRTVSNRVAGLHMDGSLADVDGGSFTTTSATPISFITTGQKFGSGAASLDSGGIRSQPSYLFGVSDFTFRFWVKSPLTASGMFAAGHYESFASFFGVFLNNGQVQLVVKRQPESPWITSIGTIAGNEFTYIEFGRVNGILRGSVDGVVSANTLDYADNLGTTWFDVGYYSSMIVDDFELLIGEGPRTVNFTPPAFAFP